MKTRTLSRTLAAALALACALPLAAWADPPPWAPAHGYRAKHRYVYYPSGEVYYAPDSRLWFWLGGDGWSFGASLPLDYQPYVRSGGISLELYSDRPYVDHTYVVEHYGGHRPDFRSRDRDRDRDRGGDRGHRDDDDHGHGHGNGRGNGSNHGKGRHGGG